MYYFSCEEWLLTFWRIQARLINIWRCKELQELEEAGAVVDIPIAKIKTLLRRRLFFFGQTTNKYLRIDRTAPVDFSPR
jgi:hypothetical protein